MKKTALFIATCFSCVGIVNAAVRDANTVNRNTNVAPQIVTRGNTNNNPRTSSKTVSRTTTPRETSPQQVTSRNITSQTQRSNNTIVRGTIVRPSVQQTAKNAPRTGKQIASTRTTTNKKQTSISRVSRAAVVTPGMESNTFGSEYNICRDAYFTCMDQFCAAQNESYRRCTCSSRLNEIKQRESLLSQTASQLQDFHDFNISVIDKTGAEVTAMISASSGEALASQSKDKSASAQQLSNITNVLNKTKSQALSTAGTLDAGGDIKQIWSTTDLADGANIANLSGEALYNAVHSQCVAMISETCSSKATLNMVVSAYGMYIENDCTALANNLDTKINAAKGSVRETERTMHTARLDNYNSHNSVYINECVANVRRDLTAKNACGTNFVHCLDVSGRYLNRETGQPIYSPQFYQLDSQISLSGDVLSNQTNRLILAELNRMRSFAANSLDKCRDLSDQVWDEFLRQSIAEIYQYQQERIRQVKNECLDVVTTCYDEQNQSLKDFSNVKEQLLLGQRLELSEELCREKLNACSNLYGGGPIGLKELVVAMHEITDAKIAQNCKTALEEYAQDLCTTPSNDTLHSYPYACRVYAPGEQKYAQNAECNQQIWDRYNSSNNAYIPSGSNLPINEEFEITEIIPTMPSTYTCPVDGRCYTSCHVGYYLADENNLPIGDSDECGYQCQICSKYPEYDPNSTRCPGGTSEPMSGITEIDPTNIEELLSTCGNYAGSMYQRLVRYALQTCVRPSDANNPNYTISIDVLQDVNIVMDKIRIDMGKNLAEECERLGGLWIDSAWVDKSGKINCTTNASGNETCTNNADGKHDATGDELNKVFYNETGANTEWGYCTNALISTTTTQQQ